MLQRFAFAPQRNARSMFYCGANVKCCNASHSHHNETHDLRFYCGANVKCCRASHSDDQRFYCVAHVKCCHVSHSRHNEMHDLRFYCGAQCCKVSHLRHNEMHDLRVYCSANVKCCHVSHSFHNEMHDLRVYGGANVKNARFACLLRCEMLYIASLVTQMYDARASKCSRKVIIETAQVDRCDETLLVKSLGATHASRCHYKSLR